MAEDIYAYGAVAKGSSSEQNSGRFDLISDIKNILSL